MLNISLRPYYGVFSLTLAVAGLVGYNFISAAWTPAPAGIPPANNAESPVNVGATYQAKTGDLGAVRMRAGLYCDAVGANCFTPLQATAGVSCVPMPNIGGRELTAAEKPNAAYRYMIMPESVSVRCKQRGYDFGHATNLFPPVNSARTDGWCGFSNARTANWVSDIDGSRWVSLGCTNFSVMVAECCSL